MLYVTIDSRDGGQSNAGACAKCCCEPVNMRPGETNLMTINYAPWSVPLGGRGIVGTPDIAVTRDATACSTGNIEGFGPPVVTIPNQVTAVGADVAIDIETMTEPSGNVFSYALVPGMGPSNGVVVLTPPGSFAYTPNAGFEGYDIFWVKVTDAQGRSIIRPVPVVVGDPVSKGILAPFGWKSTDLVIDFVKIDSRLQELSFAIRLPPSNDVATVEGCLHYRVTIAQPASDCDRIFKHITCFDVYSARC